MDQSVITPREIMPGAVVAPTPPWVDLAPYAIPAVANPHFIAGGLCSLLDDAQVDLCGPERAWYCRHAELVTAPAGAERAAQFSVSFDPAFERLEIHAIRVIRGSLRIDHAATAAFEVLRRESSLELMKFDGRLTLHVTLPDVRPGDVVETSFTTYGMRKSLAGRHSAFVSFEWPTGIVETRVRQRAPASRIIREKSFNDAPEGSQTEADGVVDRRWAALERRGVKYEQLSPPWVIQNASLQLSEWRDWAEVAEVFTPLYEEDDPLPAPIAAEAAAIASAEATPEGRAAAILRFCQGAVRYLAISMGEGGFTPRTFEAIADTRYGDCKDKSKLFVAMARALGLDACPALVNTRDSYAINAWLPSAQIFDHCIVRLSIGERTYWLDPTRAPQPSPLDKLHQCHFGWALPLRRGVTELERMPAPAPAHTLEAHEKIAFGPTPEHPVTYEYRTISRRGRAEWVREQLAREGAVGLFKLYAEDISRRYAKATPLEQDIVRDDIETNEVEAREIYELTEAWKAEGGKAEFGTHDLSMRAQLAALDAGARKHPIYLAQIGKVSRTLTIESSFDLPHLAGWKRSVDATALSFTSELRVDTPRRFVLEQTLEFKALTLPAAEADKYRAIVAELDKSDLNITGELNQKGEFIGVQEDGRESLHPVAYWGLIALTAGVIAALAAVVVQRAATLAGQ